MRRMERIFWRVKLEVIFLVALSFFSVLPLSTKVVQKERHRCGHGHVCRKMLRLRLAYHVHGFELWMYLADSSSGWSSTASGIGSALDIYVQTHEKIVSTADSFKWSNTK